MNGGVTFSMPDKSNHILLFTTGPQDKQHFKNLYFSQLFTEYYMWYSFQMLDCELYCVHLPVYPLISWY